MRLPEWERGAPSWLFPTLLPGKSEQRVKEVGTPDRSRRKSRPGRGLADTRVPEVAVPIDAKTALRVDFASDRPDGVAAPLSVREGQVTVEAREKPVLILYP